MSLARPLTNVVVPSIVANVAVAGAAPPRPPAPAVNEMLQLLERGFGTRFTILDGLSGDVIAPAAGQPACDWSDRVEVCCEVARRGKVEFIDDEEPLLVLALPWTDAGQNSYVAVAPFVVAAKGDLPAACRRLGMDPQRGPQWALRQNTWEPSALRRVSELTLAEWAAKQHIKRLEAETQSLSDHLANTYEEISLLHRLTHNLKISKSDEELGRVALEWLGEVLPAQTLALWFLPVANPAGLGPEARPKPLLLVNGPSFLAPERFARVVDYVDARLSHQPLVLNNPVTSRPDWPFPEIRQMIAVPLVESQNLFGWLMAFNHAQDGQFGTIEASMLSSVAAILGIHSGNNELYRQQSELVAGVVRALTSAIDAKDPYTCGHSDRVSQLAVRLAEELGCSSDDLHTVYLSGLLHDIGKIGINDAVLRKPGKLSESEYAHIKRHVDIGHKILVDLKKLDNVLPVVLHHHESWDGLGYPHGLAGENIPLLARILAVADSYDAMGSDRPYRRGLPDEKIDDIFRAGAGQQWDPAIVAAFFRARADLRAIVHGGGGAVASGQGSVVSGKVTSNGDRAVGRE